MLAAPLLLALCAGVSAKETRHLTGSAADVKPKLHGPAYHLQGGGTDVAAAMQWMIDMVRGCADCPAKLDVVVLRSSGADGYNDFIYKMNGVDSVETLVIKDRADASSAAVARTVRDAEVVFFAGGDQCNYVRYFKGTEVERGVERVHARGGGVGGTSAGLAVMGEVSYDACSGGSARSPDSLLNPYHADVSFTYDFFDWPPCAASSRTRTSSNATAWGASLPSSRASSAWGATGASPASPSTARRRSSSTGGARHASWARGRSTSCSATTDPRCASRGCR